MRIRPASAASDWLHCMAWVVSQTGQEREETIARDPRGERIVREAGRLQQACDPCNRLVTGIEAKHLVHDVQVIDIDVDHRVRLFGAVELDHLRGFALEDGAPLPPGTAMRVTIVLRSASPRPACRIVDPR